MKSGLILVDNLEAYKSISLRKKITIDPILFGKLVSDQRALKRLGQAELGRAIFKDSSMTYGSAQSRVSRMERGLIKIDSNIINRVSVILDIPVATIHKNCQSKKSSASAEINYNLTLEPEILNYFPSLDNYIQIINNEVKSEDLEAVTLTFEHMCEAVRRGFKRYVAKNVNPSNGNPPEE